jgi:phage terminase large subunit
MGGDLAKIIELPYAPREAFQPFHDRTSRWGCLVAHRRAGKSTAAINDLIRAALTYPIHKIGDGYCPAYSYFAPFRSQAKAVIWDRLKWHSAPVLKASNEAELKVTLMNNATVSLFGADNADAARGLGFDGMLCDEYGDFRPSIWGNVLRPTLSDRQGWAVFMGTPKGKNQFFDIYDMARSNPREWFCLTLKASQSGILPQEEIDAVRAQLSEDQFLQEYECSFEAAILGAFYGTELRELDERGRIRDVQYDPALSTFTAWDIGHSDDTSIWWFQPHGNELRIIDFYSVSGSGVEDVANFVASKPYHYEKHYLPHDAVAKTFAANGKSTIEQVVAVLGFGNVGIVPKLSVQDGIQAVRATLPFCYFDAKKCKQGIEALRQYEREYDEDTKAFRLSPKHNWASNPADAFRYLSLSWREQPAKRKINPEPILMVGKGGTATMDDMWAANKHRNRYQRI